MCTENVASWVTTNESLALAQDSADYPVGLLSGRLCSLGNEWGLQAALVRISGGRRS